MENKWKRTSEQNSGLHGLAALSFTRLIRSKEENDRDSFNTLVQKILPDIEEYMARRLSFAVGNGDLPQGKYRVADFTDELYIIAFDHIGEVEDEKDLRPWLFKKADDLFQDTVVEEALNEFFFEDIEKYTKAEWDAMQEEFSTDGDGDLMPLEEFDDPSYPKYEYHLADVFIEKNPEGEWSEKLDSELGDTEMHQHIDLVLHRLPAPMKSIYDLAVNQRFAPFEIANIKRISVEEVDSHLAKVRQGIKISLEKRYME
ncbi:sigma-70 family RNA polymerase sigma factor [Pricia sp.]|uniref:sigma-70 family RNA polymerase sigma factor n=1 Tax=Pricia sp. TaxID=2268138 RepID=UPI003592F925